ncbi:MAG: hypothetical protein BZ136_00300 [Methanosphaera sp. rholeuAM74]|nr:MAG: hypothetical protein BZ136_00300 [Methanosphaera sp. rholeuAM74]
MKKRVSGQTPQYSIFFIKFLVQYVFKILFLKNTAIPVFFIIFFFEKGYTSKNIYILIKTYTIPCIIN